MLGKKKCTKCGVEKNIPDGFHKHSIDKNGKQRYRSYCVKCAREVGRAYNKTSHGREVTKKYNKSDKAREKRKEYKKSEAGKEANKKYRKSESGRVSSRKGALKYYHSEHGNKKAKEYVQTDKGKEVARNSAKKYRNSEYGKDKAREYEKTDKCKEQRKKYSESDAGKASRARRFNRRRSKIKSAVNNLTATQWLNILETQENKCNHCEKPFTDELKPTRDHIVPVSKGGGLTPDNVQALCRSCNSSKGTKDNSEIVNRLGDK